MPSRLLKPGLLRPLGAAAAVIALVAGHAAAGNERDDRRCGAQGPQKAGLEQTAWHGSAGPHDTARSASRIGSVSNPRLWSRARWTMARSVSAVMVSSGLQPMERGITAPSQT